MGRQHARAVHFHDFSHSPALPPPRYSLKSFDIMALKALAPHVNLVPIIAKADTLTRVALDELKENV